MTTGATSDFSFHKTFVMFRTVFLEKMLRPRHGFSLVKIGQDSRKYMPSLRFLIARRFKKETISEHAKELIERRSKIVLLTCTSNKCVKIAARP